MWKGKMNIGGNQKQIHPRCTYLILIPVLALTLLLASGCISKPGQPSTGPVSTPDSSTLTYYTEQWPPYSYQENDTLKGVAVDLLGEITGKMGKKVTPDQVHLVPWTEGYQAALTGKKTVLFSTARLPEREQSFKWAGPIFTDRYVLFAGPESSDHHQWSWRPEGVPDWSDHR